MECILLMARLPKHQQAALARTYRVLGPYDGPVLDSIPPADRAAIRACFTGGTAGASAGLIAALPNLGLIACWGSGYEGVDLAAARARGIPVTHSPGSNAASVADLAMALMLASIRRVAEGDRLVRTGLWTKQNRAITEMRGLTGRKVGILGLGLIGKKIADRASAFETEIGYHNRRRRDDVAWPYFETPLALAEWADVLVVATRLDESTRHMISRDMLDALGPQGHVVNIARGPIVDEAELTRALAERRIAGAGLDVFEREPEMSEELRALPNVVLTPHLGGGTLDARDGMYHMVLANLAAFFAGRPLINPVPEG